MKTNIISLERQKRKINKERKRLRAQRDLTVSAATRFKPTPPALVVIKKTKAPLWSASEFKTESADGPLKLLIAAKRSSALIDPSRRA